MKRKVTALIMFLLMVVLIGCSSNKDVDTSRDVKLVTQDHENAEDTTISKEIEWYEEYDNPKIWLSYFWNQDVSINELQKESAEFIDKNNKLFPTTSKEEVINLIDKDLAYKHIEKSYQKHVDTLFDIEGYVVNIEEGSIEDFGIITILNIIDDDLNSYQVLYLEELPDIYKEDIVYLVGLPMGMGGFENMSGGYTKTVVTLGSYIEKIE